MDILRKELDEIYYSQHLERESLDAGRLDYFKDAVRAMSQITGGCCVITDASCDRCYVFGGVLARSMGWAEGDTLCRTVDSSDEDFIYNRLHPADLPDKRLLEYEFFKSVNPMDVDAKLHAKARCRIRIKDKNGRYVWIDNSTQVMCPSPSGRIWLILCCYELSPDQSLAPDITPRIVDSAAGRITNLSFLERRAHLLSEREKEVLNLIKSGKSSKMIADVLNISINTVNRHRQNILEKLSVANSFEAITAAESMKLL